MDRSIDEFKQAIKVKEIKFWPIHNCSFCHYECGYLFREDKVFYDSGCHCVTYLNVRPMVWLDVANMYNVQRNEKMIKKFDEFFGFTEKSI